MSSTNIERVDYHVDYSSGYLLGMSDIGHTEHMPTITLTQGQRLRYAREFAGLKQDQIGAMLRVGKSVVSNWEHDGNVRGAPYAALLVIAQATGFPVEFFEPLEVEFAPITATDTETVIGGYLQPHAYDLPLFAFPVAA